MDKVKGSSLSWLRARATGVTTVKWSAPCSVAGFHSGGRRPLTNARGSSLEGVKTKKQTNKQIFKR